MICPNCGYAAAGIDYATGAFYIEEGADEMLRKMTGTQIMNKSQYDRVREVIREVPIEVVREVIREIEVPVEVEKIIEVPGPERIVEKPVDVIREVEVERLVHVPERVEVPVEVEVITHRMPTWAKVAMGAMAVAGAVGWWV